MSSKLLRAKLDVIYLYLSFKQKDQMYPIEKHLSLSLRYFYFFLNELLNPCRRIFKYALYDVRIFLKGYDHNR